MRHFFVGVLPREVDMIEFGKWLGHSLLSYIFVGPEPKTALIFLGGDLGAGKTTICRGILQAFGYDGVVKSPTYTLVESYDQGLLKVHHFDLYRLGSAEELEFFGIRDYFHQNGCCLVEWPERGHGFLPMADLQISIIATHEGREIKICSETDMGDLLLTHLASDRENQLDF